ARAKRGTFHVQDPASIEPAQIRHRDPKTGREITTRDWLPAGAVVVGVSAGASTPDTELAEVVRRLCVAAGAAGPPAPEAGRRSRGARRRGDEGRVDARRTAARKSRSSAPCIDSRLRAAKRSGRDLPQAGRIRRGRCRVGSVHVLRRCAGACVSSTPQRGSNATGREGSFELSDSRHSFEGDRLFSALGKILLFLVPTFLILVIATCAWFFPFDEKTVETVRVASPDGRFAARIDFKSMGVIGG